MENYVYMVYLILYIGCILSISLGLVYSLKSFFWILTESKTGTIYFYKSLNFTTKVMKYIIENKEKTYFQTHENVIK